ncbi:biopolymer transporter ExbD [Candidatus Venteria ishoeyi]|uniref:biopolymer transporter ExbD n=1 Tax=Candidatus Venteria ishoeyi TaxID=1899563 RepID=UPI0025A51F59|nr:biopolymer transporter ExbD [Candidatus Venteria ishoeyi]MDM8545254.1 biopolymer transporter ExbD [Candidatus Venteria ishoeyi]
MPVYRRRRRLMAEMNVVPYIDVMLVLLIIFMVTSPMLDLTQGVEVDLPVIETAPNTPDPALPVLIKVIKSGVALLSDENAQDQAYAPHNWQQLGAHVLAHLRINRQRPVVISADRQVTYEQVLRLIAMLEGNGVKVRLMTRPLRDEDNRQGTGAK